MAALSTFSSFRVYTECHVSQLCATSHGHRSEDYFNSRRVFETSFYNFRHIRLTFSSGNYLAWKKVSYSGNL